MRVIEQAWQTRGPLACLLWPLSLLYRSLLALRQFAYLTGLKKTGQVSLPVVVVGNFSVGGTGKTPLCLYLVEHFRQAGWTPSIVSRGYGGPPREQPHQLTTDDTAETVGDEPLMLFQQTGVPVCVCVNRNAAVQHLSTHTDTNIVFADDGLQHLAMPRAAQILVIDGARGFGNRWLLPAGPLRSSLRQRDKFDVVAIQVPSHGAMATSPHLPAVSAPQDLSSLHESLSHPSAVHLIDESTHCQFLLKPTYAVRISTGVRAELADFTGQPVHAVAGIGHPQRFFDTLTSLGMEVIPHPMTDHHRFKPEDLSFDDDYPVLVTSKDAVKLKSFTSLLDKVFEVRVRVQCTESLEKAVEALQVKLRDAAAVNYPE